MPGLSVSVIIPCYNEQEHIRKCLGTITKQSLGNYEVIVVDDGSTDRTRNIVKEFNVRLIEQDHRGPGTARNLAASKSTADILVFVDADMYFDEKFLEFLTEPIRNGVTIGAAPPDEFLGNPENNWALCWNLEQCGSPIRRTSTEQGDESIHFRAILRSKFLEAGGFDTKVGYEDDSTLYTKLGVKAKFAQGATCYHNNPDKLLEVFVHARWLGRGKRFVGHRHRLIKFFFPFSVFFSVWRAWNYRKPAYFVFKMVYDFGTFIGGMSRMLTGKYAK